MTVPLPIVTPLAHPSSGPSSLSGLGATVTHLDLAALFDPAHRTPGKARSTPQFKALEDAVYRYKVVVVKHQDRLAPEQQYEVVKAFDPAAQGEQGHNNATVEHKGQKSLLFGIGNAIGTHPEVKLVGGGIQSERFGGRVLKQADHVAYHKHPLSETEREAGLTRWHRWHMDAALFRTSLPLVTSLLCLATPSISPDGVRNPRLTVRWDDGSGLEMEVDAGSTGFVAGTAVYEALSDEERRWCDERFVEYAPWPYQWNGPTRGNSNGLGTFDEPDNTMPLDDLPPWDPADVKTYPLVWKHHRTGDKALMVHSVAVRAIHHPPSGTSITSLSEIRSRLAALQRKAFVPERICAHAYEVGDLVIFDNRAVYHSATDYPDRFGTRTMLQAHVAASFDPK
ncbi:uncharacterized protein RHOBADRAFT_55432 [Rhodotorula graminis WP1]|uniref:TauD/TfdA-like domain-containing protein n=1 Tax=Rhodotorula graminis (strain WP1) TaxID=578459 RepID=A0A0P9GID3_RHOGW|nr:uncharacterized protein RHOBADRAFT_55432 [Rhodotorula graminis WP1]KPV72736.1 hypothetical protein RHOBADRAFT_55432 [Rhodotorula graminis WP1]